MLVRGFAASIAASAQRLNAMAAERAATMATTIHRSWWIGRKSSRRKHGAAESKRERKDGMLPLDHLQRYTQIMQNGHGSIVKQRGLRSWVLGLGSKWLGLRQPF